MLELNKTYVVKDKKIRVTKYKTRLGKLLLLVDVNSSTCYVSYEDAKRKGIIKALSDLRRFNNKLTVGQYNMIGTAIHLLSVLKNKPTVEDKPTRTERPVSKRPRGMSEMAYVTGRPTPSNLYRPAGIH